MLTDTCSLLTECIEILTIYIIYKVSYIKLHKLHNAFYFSIKIRYWPMNLEYLRFFYKTIPIAYYYRLNLFKCSIIREQVSTLITVETNFSSCSSCRMSSSWRLKYWFGNLIGDHLIFSLFTTRLCSRCTNR